MEFKIFNDINNDIKSLRYEVFCVEQGIDQKDEWDNLDKGMIHVCLYDNDTLIAYCRCFLTKEDGHIGRVIVKKSERHKGLGSKLITKAEDILFAQRKVIKLNSQEKVIPFYASLGYKVIGDMFYDANIPHYTMTKSL